MISESMLRKLLSLGIHAWYWKSQANAEVDYIIEDKGQITPIEVKAADNAKAKSLKIFCERYHPSIAVKTSLKNVGDSVYQNTRIWSIPLYTFFKIKEYLEPSRP